MAMAAGAATSTAGGGAPLTLPLLLVVSVSAAAGDSVAALPRFDDLVAAAGEVAPAADDDGDDDLRLLRVATMVGSWKLLEWQGHCARVLCTVHGSGST